MKVGRSFEAGGPIHDAYAAAQGFYGSLGFHLTSGNPPYNFTGQRGTAGGTTLGLKTADVNTALTVNLNDLGGRVSVFVEYDILTSVWLGLGDAPEKHKAALESEIAQLQHHLTVSVRGPLAAPMTPLTTPAPTGAAAPLNFCSSCGQRLAPGKFCQACGSPIPHP